MYSEVRTEALARPGAPLEWQGGRTLTGLERGCCLRDLQARAVTRPAASAAPTQKMALPALTAMAAGLMIGSGIFMLPRRFGDATGVFDALIAWAVAGGGMFTLARVFQSLAQRKPDLDAGVDALVAGWISI